MIISELTRHWPSPVAGAGLRPTRTHFRSSLETEGPLENSPTAQDLLTHAEQFNGTSPTAMLFGPFRLLPTQRLLLDADKPVRIGSRALDILVALVERRGELVSKGELMARVWPDTIVVEANLSVHVAALRRILRDGRGGNRYLVNIPGRGYRFVAPVILEQALQQPSPPASKRGHNLPPTLTPLFGRADDIGQLAERLTRRRLLTIAGPGGVGKTAVAVGLAERLIHTYEYDVRMVDLSPLSDPRLVPIALSAALGLKLPSENPHLALIAALRDKRTLLVLDTCEHVVASVAALAEAVLRGAPGVCILATSREPLRAEGECIHRLPPLASPCPSAQLSAAEALTFPAIQLFVERAAANSGAFELSDADAQVVTQICWKLDGLPLAIEFASARAETLGVRAIAARIDNSLQLLTGGLRTALPRHQTMSATLDWSYGLLSEIERSVFRRLAIFEGDFSLQSAGEVVADADHLESEIFDQVIELVAKSLVAGTAKRRFRLLETTRAYALGKLAESGELDALERRYSRYTQNPRKSDPELFTRPLSSDWLLASVEGFSLQRTGRTCFG